MHAKGHARTRLRKFGSLFYLSMVAPVTPKVEATAINNRQVSCTKCGTQNADTDKFCAKCGTPLNPPARPIVPVTPKGEITGEKEHQLFCATCGTQNPDSYKFCAKCGTQLVTPAPQAAQAAPKIDTVIMDATGVNAHLDLFQEKITIKRQDQDISLLQISSVQIKEAGDSTNGYLKFELYNDAESIHLLIHRTRASLSKDSACDTLYDSSTVVMPKFIGESVVLRFFE